MIAPGLVPALPRSVAGLVDPGDASARGVALRHALLHDRPGLWADDAECATGVVWVRAGDGRLEAFAAGRPGAVVAGLAAWARRRPIALAAPESWLDGLPGRSEIGTTLIARPEVGMPPVASPVPVRRLVRADAIAFAAGDLAWAVAPWGDPGSLIARGAAFGVPHGAGFAALAWIHETDGLFAKLGVATDPRFRRLGLGHTAAAALIDAIRGVGGIPLWATAPGNAASLALARSLGFAEPAAEPWALWHPAP